MTRREKVVIFTINDPVFTLPVISKIIKHLSKKYCIEVYFGKKSLKKILKTILCILFYSSIYDLIINPTQVVVISTIHTSIDL